MQNLNEITLLDRVNAAISNVRQHIMRKNASDLSDAAFFRCMPLAEAFKQNVDVVASVLILKFLCSCFMIADCSAAEAFDRSEDVVGRFYPSERFWIGVTDLDIGVDRCFQLGRRSMHTPFDLLL